MHHGHWIKCKTCDACSASCGRPGQRVVNLDTLQLQTQCPRSELNNFSDVIIVAFGGLRITRQFYLQVCACVRASVCWSVALL